MTGPSSAEMSDAIDQAMRRGLEAAGQAIEAAAKSIIGQERHEWAPLARATIDEKTSMGFINQVSPTDPLLRTGALRESYSHQVAEDGRSVTVGSTSPIAVFQELGTAGIPPRPVLQLAVQQTKDEIMAAIRHELDAALAQMRR